MGRGRGRGRGKGRKQTVVSQEGPGNGSGELFPAYRRRGRPQKPLTDDIDEEETEKITEEEGEDAKAAVSSKEVKVPTLENGKKRNMHQKVNENSESAIEDDTSIRSGTGEPSRCNGFRQNGSRRKTKPRRAAEAGVEWK